MLGVFEELPGVSGLQSNPENEVWLNSRLTTGIQSDRTRLPTSKDRLIRVKNKSHHK